MDDFAINWYNTNINRFRQLTSSVLYIFEQFFVNEQQ